MRWCLVILIVTSYFQAYAQNQTVNSAIGDSVKTPAAFPLGQRPSIQEIFKRIEHGLQTNALETLGKEMGTTISLTIRSGEHGYYSASQALSIITGYFSDRRLISVAFSPIYDNAPAPFATGHLTFMHKGVQESTQIYISLMRQDSVWVINQFNIY
jgi:hypothetical protein